MSPALLERAIAYADTVLARLTVDDLGLATPCDGWDVRRVVLHLADVADGLVDLLASGRLALPEPPRTDAADPVPLLQARLDRLVAALSATDAPARVEAATQAGAIELTVHGWDIGTACDPGHATPAGLAGEVLALATSLVGADARGPLFGPPLDTPAGSAPDVRLAAFLGRRSAAPALGARRKQAVPPRS